MNCHDFERDWNERLDARDPSHPALDGHAASCPTCRALDARYRALDQAIRSLPTPSAPSSVFTDRVLAAAAAWDEAPAILRFVRRPAALAAAAAALVAAVALGLSVSQIGRKAPETPLARVRAIDPKDLSDALADAGTATWDLAREASAPAARVGRQVLGSAGLPRATPALSLPESMGSAADVWQRVEGRVSAGARPLGGTARHAFGFLIGVAPDDDPPPARPADGA
jgi:hypothetical protein